MRDATTQAIQANQWENTRYMSREERKIAAIMAQFERMEGKPSGSLASPGTPEARPGDTPSRRRSSDSPPAVEPARSESSASAPAPPPSAPVSRGSTPPAEPPTPGMARRARGTTPRTVGVRNKPAARGGAGKPASRRRASPAMVQPAPFGRGKGPQSPSSPLAMGTKSFVFNGNNGPQALSSLRKAESCTSSMVAAATPVAQHLSVFQQIIEENVFKADDEGKTAALWKKAAVIASTRTNGATANGAPLLSKKQRMMGRWREAQQQQQPRPPQFKTELPAVPARALSNGIVDISPTSSSSSPRSLPSDVPPGAFKVEPSERSAEPAYPPFPFAVKREPLEPAFEPLPVAPTLPVAPPPPLAPPPPPPAASDVPPRLFVQLPPAAPASPRPSLLVAPVNGSVIPAAPPPPPRPAPAPAPASASAADAAALAPPACTSPPPPETPEEPAPTPAEAAPKKKISLQDYLKSRKQACPPSSPAAASVAASTNQSPSTDLTAILNSPDPAPQPASDRKRSREPDDDDQAERKAARLGLHSSPQRPAVPVVEADMPIGSISPISSDDQDSPAPVVLPSFPVRTRRRRRRGMKT